MHITDKTAITTRLRGALVALDHNDLEAARSLIVGALEEVARRRGHDAREAVMRGLDEETRQTLAEVRAMDLGEAVGADSVECDGRRLR